MVPQLLRSVVRQTHATSLAPGTSIDVSSPAPFGWSLVIDHVSWYYYGDDVGGWFHLQGSVTHVSFAGVVGDSPSAHFHEIGGPIAVDSTDDLLVVSVTGTVDCVVTYHFEQDPLFGP